jgi:hypothetical protein
MAYRMAVSATKASLNLQSSAAANLVTVTARWTGAFGNDLSVSVVNSLADATKKEFRVYLGSTLLEKFLFDNTVGTDSLIAAVGNSSNYVILTKIAAGVIKDYANTPLAGGTSGLSITATQMTAAFSAFEGRASEWNILAVPTTDAAIQSSAVDFVKRLRSEGSFVTLCLGHTANNDLAGAKSKASSINSEAVVYHNVGAVIDGVTRAPYELVGKLAGMIAGAGPDQSITYAEVQNIDSLVNVLTHTQVKEALKSGLLVAFNDGTANRVEKGINTLTRYGEGQHEGYSKIKVVAIMDAIGNALTQSANRNYIGKVLNDEAGQQALIGAIKDAFDQYAQGRLIKPGYTVALDPNRPSVGDMVFLTMGITPVDAMEEVYATIRVGR